MTSEEVVPDRVRDVFVAALTPGTTHIAAFPDPLPLGRRMGLVAPEGSTRERIRVHAEHDETGYFLDFYKVGNDGETSSHCRIREDGSITPLENLILAHRHFDDPEQDRQERERRAAHNRRVVEILRAKGLYL
ncbi:hypothetical protein [Streptomyces sp. CB02115]|uniref:hypothetical protein n=1 Tax=Streptomyces sp. CB02115 TaxID=1703939 RepID=UPI00096128D8|nr:hypothetical protein [Streptomyces sp. CB02115]OKJ54147.1 hypothetical protein AMK28_18665 [Streptomyces sp. CB02115]